MNIEQTEAFSLIQKDFPHISSKLLEYKGSYEFTEYIFHLLLDTRDGGRRGFPQEIASAILTLVQMHDFYYPGANSHNQSSK